MRARRAFSTCSRAPRQPDRDLRRRAQGRRAVLTPAHARAGLRVSTSLADAQKAAALELRAGAEGQPERRDLRQQQLRPGRASARSGWVAGGIAPPGTPRARREPLSSPGSCHPALGCGRPVSVCRWCCRSPRRVLGPVSWGSTRTGRGVGESSGELLIAFGVPRCSGSGASTWGRERQRPA